MLQGTDFFLYCGVGGQQIFQFTNFCKEPHQFPAAFCGIKSFLFPLFKLFVFFGSTPAHCGFLLKFFYFASVKYIKFHCVHSFFLNFFCKSDKIAKALMLERQEGDLL